MPTWIRCLFAALLIAGAAIAPGAPTLQEGFVDPPPEAGLRAYWWWLNGNVDKAAITRDLEAMKANHFGGALVCDAGGATQGGHKPVPAGPRYMSPEWRALFKHTLTEAHRLGLEISLNIQSGWNLGGPMVTPDIASKRVTFSQTTIAGGAKVDQVLPQPKSNLGFYRDIAVLAYPVASVERPDELASATCNGQQEAFPVARAIDGDPATYWVSEGAKFGDGPTPARPHWIELTFKKPVTVDSLTLLGRAGYSPHDCQLQASDDGKAFREITSLSLEDGKPATVKFARMTGSHFRIVITSAFDRGRPAAPRNAQVAELSLKGPDFVFPSLPARRRGIQNLADKAVFREVGFSAPVTWPLLEHLPDTPGDVDCRTADIQDLTSRMDASGRLQWDAPDGRWTILRIGYTPTGAKVSTSSDTWTGLALDHMSPVALKAYWEQNVEPLIADAGPLAGTTFKYVHTDSWELGGCNWTPTFADEFRKRRGYAITPYLPVMCGKIVDSRDISNRFLADLRKTVGDLVADNHYAVMAKLAHAHGMGIHPESGGPHGAPVDALKCLGRSDIPMNEFWAPQNHRPTDISRFFTKQAACAAHIYGHRYVNAEGPTSIGPQWDELPWRDIKAPFDREICSGLNRVVWHAFTCSPASMGVPGQEYFAGTHFNPQVTWWKQSSAMTLYMSRVQYLMQQGLFVADVCYYYGDHVPNFVRYKEDDPAKVMPGYDYDVINEEVLLTRMSVRDGRLVLPDGMSYRMLVLPDHPILSLAAARKISELVHAGATILGPRPAQTVSLTEYPASEQELAHIADDLWGATPAPHRKVGQGEVFCDQPTRNVLTELNVPPDFEVQHATDGAHLDYIHRRDGQTEIYFVANRNPTPVSATALFRVSGKRPELWDALDGRIRAAGAFTQRDGRTALPLSLPAQGSIFVIFRNPIPTDLEGTAARNFPDSTPVLTLSGPWHVTFPPNLRAPASADFAQLESWTNSSSPGVRDFSGAATYHKTFDLPAGFDRSGHKLYLDLNDVRVMARVSLNGTDLGIVWTPPYRVDITDAVRPTGNTLEIQAVNGWLNRVLADQTLPPDQRLTHTNIVLQRGRKPMESGLLGPVQIRLEKP